MSVLDASAVLALLNGEPGARAVSAHIANGAMVSAVNYAEVATKLADLALPDAAARGILEALGLLVQPFDDGQALTTGVMRSGTRDAGLSLGDRACLALAHHVGMTAVTADRAWQGLTDVVVEVIR